MALPPLAVSAYVYLGNANGTANRSSGSIISNYIDTGPPNLPGQQPFSSYKWFYKDYPNEILAKVLSSGVPTIGGSLYLNLGSQFDGSFKYVDPIITAYNPAPCGSDLPPDPNGTAAEAVPTSSYASVQPSPPRWYTDTAYDYHALHPTFGVQTPQTGDVYYAGDFFSGKPWSCDLSVASIEADVLNLCTNTIENYPMARLNLELDTTAKVKIEQSVSQYCCWNKGTVIKGKLGIKSVDVSMVADDDSANFSITVGSSYNSEADVSWEVTIDPDFVPTAVSIPPVSGRISFVNDFWITEVTPPA